MKCRRPRPCASLPRRRASAADVAAVREDIAALDRGIVEAATTGTLERARLDELEEQLAGIATFLIEAHRREGIPLPPCLGGAVPLRLIQGGAA